MLNPKVLSVFSGAGGLDIGLEWAGYSTVGCLEIDTDARRTLALNRPDWPLLLDGDVITAASDLSPIDLGLGIGELDLLAGGPPCQPFSMAAQWSGGRRGMDDDRAGTVHGLLDLLERFLPRAVMLENVLGFVQGPNSALPEIQARLRRIERKTKVRYQLHWKLVNAADYGVPQNRRRVIVVMLRDSVDWEWPEPTHAQSPLTAWDALAGLPTEASYVPATGKWADLLPLIPPGKNYQWLTSTGGGPELFGYRTKYWNFLLKLHPDLPAWTLSASPGPSTGPFHWESRPLSAAESLRLQSFSDDWVLVGDARSQTKLVGNATPPRLAWAFGRSIRSALGYDENDSAPAYPGADTVSPRAEVLDQVPSRFVPIVGAKSAHPGHGRGPRGTVTLAEGAAGP